MGVQAPSSPLVIVSSPLPVPKVFFQPRPCSSRPAPSGSRPTYWSASAAPWVLPKLCPPAIERDGLLVVHGHASERLADVLGRGERTWLTIRPLGIDVDEAHLHRTERIREIPLAAVALIGEPGVLRPPIDVLFGFPDVLTPASETERREAHRLQGDVPREDQQVGPREPRAVLLLHRPQRTARLVQVRVVRPTVERRETLRTRAGATPAVVDAVRAGAVPCHPDEQWPVVAVVGRPPVLRRRHHLAQVRLHTSEVEARELRRVVERFAHRIDQGRVLVQHPEVQLIRPPVLVRQRTRPRCANDSTPGISLPALAPHRWWQPGRCLRCSWWLLSSSCGWWCRRRHLSATSADAVRQEGQ